MTLFGQPENILVTEKNDDCRKVKLADFGNAMSQKEAVCYFDDFNVQSLPYRAPEVCGKCRSGQVEY